MLFFSVLGLVMTTDPPAFFLWLLVLCFSAVAVTENKPVFWIYAGISSGLAFLTKGTALLLYPGITLFLLLSPAYRFHLKSRGYQIGCLMFLLLLVPVVVWNAQHDWINLYHNARHLTGRSELSLHIKYLPELIFAQVGLIGPLLFVGIVYAYIVSFWQWRAGDSLSGLFFCTGVPLGAICLAVSLMKRVYANWPVPVFIGGLLLLTHLYSTGKLNSARINKLLVPALAINLLLLLIAYLPILGITLGIPGQYLTTKKLVGWKELGEIVSFEQKALAASGYQPLDGYQPSDGRLPLDDRLPFLLTNSYGIASELAFYVPGHPAVFCAEDPTRRMNQYDVWGGLNAQHGKDALIVLKHDELPVAIQDAFEEVVPLSRTHPVVYSETTIRTFRLYHGKHFLGSQAARYTPRTSRY